MTRFRPCIDLHSGAVKQIVGGTLTSTPGELQTNHVSPHPARYFAQLYREKELEGAHVIMLGPGNEEAAREAVGVWRGGLQVGGGVNEGNAGVWIERGAGKVGVSVSVSVFGGGGWRRMRGDGKAMGRGLKLMRRSRSL